MHQALAERIIRREQDHWEVVDPGVRKTTAGACRTTTTDP